MQAVPALHFGNFSPTHGLLPKVKHEAKFIMNQTYVHYEAYE
jgi:hypothetical protein